MLTKNVPLRRYLKFHAVKRSSGSVAWWSLNIYSSIFYKKNKGKLRSIYGTFLAEIVIWDS